MLPAAPGLFSTTIGWPSSSPIFGCMIRPTKSDAPPGAKGMIMRTGLLGTVALRATVCYHNFAVRVVDIEHALGAGDAHFQAVHSAGPHHGQRPGNRRVVEGAVLEGDHAGGGVDALAQRSERLVHRA